MTLSALNDQWLKLFSGWKDARRGKDKAVHELRVTSRRIAASLEILEGLTGEAEVSRVRRQVKKVVQHLGKLRDVQVLCGLVESLKPPIAVKPFSAYLKRLERQEKDRLESNLDRSERRKLKKQWKKVSKGLAHESFRAIDTRRAAQHVVKDRSDRVRVAEKRLNFRNLKSVHSLRIGLKKLRYTFEGATNIAGAPASARIDEMIKHQKELGDIRDLEMLRKHLRRWSVNQDSLDKAKIRPIQVRLGKDLQTRLEAFSRRAAAIR
jgi:CHAD domain-containing protein